MKGIKKLLSIVMVLTLVLSLGATALAVDITVNEHGGGAAGTYKAYRLMTLTTTADATEDSEGYAYTVNPKYSEILQTAAGVESDEAVIKYLNENKDNPDMIREFADAVYKAIIAAEMEADEESENGQFTGVEQGYYLIVEEGAAGGATSAVMLDTAGREDVTITTKEDVPKSEKKVQDKNDTTGDSTGWQDSADWDIGDTVPFQLTGTLPSNYGDYDEYAITFHDKESTGLTFNAESVVVTAGGETLVEDEDYIVKVPGSEEGCTFEIIIHDLKTSAPGAEAGSQVVVTYNATLNENAVIGSAGNPNTMYMEFSSNPYGEGTGKTPEDTVIVFTFELDIDKVDGEEKPLAGAGFTLYKKDTSGEYQQVGSEVMAEETESGSYTADFKGLDDGEYKIVETTVPDGYNKAADIEFTVTATHTAESPTPELEELTVTVTSPEGFEMSADVASGVVSTDVVNNTGVELPETGGIGTTIFYVAGAILVAGAVILLVTKKRVNGAGK